MEFEMEFEQKILYFLLAEGKYRDSRLRPDDIKKISTIRSCNLIEFEINSSPIGAFQADKCASQALMAERKEQYAFICLLSELDDEKALGFALSPKEIVKLRSLSYNDIVQLTNSLDENVVSVNVNVKRLDMAIHQRLKRNKRQALIEELVKAGATKLFMSEKYMLHPKKYTFLRNAYQLVNAVGRPRILTEQESHAVYELWLIHSSLPVGEAYLKIFKEINKGAAKQINIRNIALAVRESIGQQVNAQ